MYEGLTRYVSAVVSRMDGASASVSFYCDPPMPNEDEDAIDMPRSFVIENLMTVQDELPYTVELSHEDLGTRVLIYVDDTSELVSAIEDTMTRVETAVRRHFNDETIEIYTLLVQFEDEDYDN